MSDLHKLLELLHNDPTHSLTLGKLYRFITYAVSLKDDILLAQPSSHPPQIAPDHLPPSIQSFLASACEFTNPFTDLCWYTLKETIWHGGGEFTQQENENIFMQLGQTNWNSSTYI